MNTIKKTTGIFVLVLWLSLMAQPAWAQDSGMEFFHGTWEEVLVEAKKERKLIFVDAYTVWCGPCKMMSRNTFTDEAVGKYYNKNFVNYKFDMEKGEGPQWAAKYQVRAYPSLYYINYKGEIVHKHVGYLPPDKFLSAGQVAMRPENNEANLDLSYKDNALDGDELYTYAVKMKTEGKDYREAANKYFASRTDKELCSKAGWEAINTLSSDVKAREFQLLLKKRKKFMKKYAGPAAVEAKIADVFKKNVVKAAVSGNDAAYSELVTMAQEKVKDKGKMAARIKMTYAETKKNWDLYARSTIDFFDQYNLTDAYALNNIAHNFFLHVDNREYLKRALAWARQSVALENHYYNNDTYASLLYKVGNYQEAMRIANKAISIAQLNEESYEGTETLLEQIRAKLN